MFIENRFDTGELSLNVAEGGHDGLPIVFLHGLTSFWREYGPLLHNLTQFGRVYAPDLRGHGQSGRGDSYQPKDYERDIATFLQQHIRKPAVLVGHSLGALVAMRLAARHPKYVQSLVLLDPPLCIREVGPEAMPEINMWMTWVYEMASEKRPFSEIVSSCRQMMPDIEDEATIEMLAQTIAALDPNTVTFFFEKQPQNGALEALIQAIQAPTLLLHGDWEMGAVVRDKDAALLQACLPAADVVKVANAGHMLHQEQPSFVWEHIEQFLAGVPETAVV